jgi:ribonuclease E
VPSTAAATPSGAASDGGASDGGAPPAAATRRRSARSRAAGAQASQAGDPEGAPAGQHDDAGASGQRAGAHQDGDETSPRAATASRTASRRSSSSRSRSGGGEAAAHQDAASHDSAGSGAAGSGAAGSGAAGAGSGAGDAGGQGDSASGAPARAAAPAAFQPPLVIFQPPDIAAARPPAPPRQERQQPPASTPRTAAAAADTDDGDRDGDGDGHEEGAPGSAASRRRRRGGRGRGKGTSGISDGAEASTDGAAERAEPEDAADDADDLDEDGGSETTATGKRRRRRRRSGTGGDGEVQAAGTGPDDPPNTVVHVRPVREKTATSDVSDVRAVKGSTRLEAKRQRRREGRESGRRRPPIITESEFLARREAVERVMVVRQHADRTQIAVLEDNVLVEHYVDKASHQSYVGNVYLGKVQNVLPSMEAAFVDIGKGRNAVLYAGEVNFDASGLEGESKRIESALKSGQSILVQVTKDPIGHKGARLTSQVSLPGRYLVYVPGASMTGISRKLPDTERSRLKQILKQVMPENAGVIVRTAAEGASEEELSRDVARLAAQWEAIEKKTKTASAPDLLYSEPDLTLRVVRDIFNEDFSNLIIASDSEWDLVDEYVRYVAPHLSDRMERWDDGKDVFASYRIDEQLAKALERKVWLPSGGSLVIDHTEAMTVIDVNTGKFTGQGGNLEQTVTRNNLEAAEEIVRQLRLRDLGGIIVIDFIDMVLESNRELVLRRLLECLARDRTKHQVAEVTSLGLVQMTRKRVGSGLLEAFSVPCEHCNGRGVMISMEPVDHSHPHGRDSGRGGSPGKTDNSAGNGVARDGGGRDGGSRDGGGRDGGSRDGGGRDGGTRGGRGRGSGSRRDAGAREDADRTAGTGSEAPAPSPAVVAAASSALSDGALRDGPGADAGGPDSAAVSTAANGLGPSGPAADGPADGAPGTGATGLAEPTAGDADGAAPAVSRSTRSRSGRSRRSGPARPAGGEPDASGDGQAVEPASS